MKIGRDVYEVIRYGKYQLWDSEVTVEYQLCQNVPDAPLELDVTLKGCSEAEGLSYGDMDILMTVMEYLVDFKRELDRSRICVDYGLPPVPAEVREKIEEVWREENCCEIFPVLQELDYEDPRMWREALQRAREDMDVLTWKLMRACAPLADLAGTSDAFRQITELVGKMEELDKTINRLSISIPEKKSE